MSDLSRILERESDSVDLSVGGFRRLLERRDRKRRNQRIVSAALALILAVAAIGSLVYVFRSSTRQRPGGGPTITSGNVSNLKLIGTTSVNAGFYVSDGLAYVADQQTLEVRAYPLACFGVKDSCDPVWNARVAGTDGFGGIGLEFGSGVVYMAADNVYAFSSSCGTGGETCQPLWTGAVPFPPTSVEVGSHVTIALSKSRLYAFPISCAQGSGPCQPAWVSSRLPAGEIYPVVFGDSVIVKAPRSDTYLVFREDCATDGSVCRPSASWTVPGGSAPVVLDRSIFITGYGRLMAYPQSCVTGGACQPTWSVRLDLGFLEGAGGGKLFVGKFGGGLWAFPARCPTSRCGPLWEARGLPTGGLTSLGLTTSNGVLFVFDNDAPKFGSPRGGIYAFPTDCGSDGATCEPIWTWGTAEHVGIDGVTVAGSRVYATSGVEAAGDLYLFGVGSKLATKGTNGLNPAGSHTATALFYVALVVLAAAVPLLRVRRRRATR